MVKLLFLLLSLLSHHLFAQYKYEHEISISAEEVPLTARTFIKNSGLTKKVKWFKEYALISYSFEAKTKLANLWYSIEFDSLGKLEDIEVTRQFSALTKGAQQKIHQQLSHDFDKWKIKKVQFQYLGEFKNVQDATSEMAELRYELIVYGKRKLEPNQGFEFTFDDQGNLISKKGIKPIKIDNIEN